MAAELSEQLYLEKLEISCKSIDCFHGHAHYERHEL